MSSIFGSDRHAPFTKRKLKTLCGAFARQSASDDMKKTVELFMQLRDEDPDFTYKVDFDDDGTIRTLMWTNGYSKMQYSHFGDVVSFDTTYKTNLYGMPFGMFVGVNNHFQSIIFAGVLMRSETICNFKWVFREFSSMMGSTKPQTVLTDQAHAMRVALESEWPNTRHRWCKWHVLCLAKEHIGYYYNKTTGFKKKFHSLVSAMLTPNEFERRWQEVMGEYGLLDNSFVSRIYTERRMWAKPYFADFMKILSQRIEDEDFEERRSKREEHTPTMNTSIERHAMKIYSPKMMKLVQKHLYDAGYYRVECVEAGCRYVAVHEDKKHRYSWSRAWFMVTIEGKGDLYRCECGRTPHMGLLCCHIFKVMMHLDVAEIPPAHIVKRWTKNARDVLPPHLTYLQKNNPSLKSHTFWHCTALISAFELVQLADCNRRCYEEFVKIVADAKVKLCAIEGTSDGLSLQDKATHNEESNNMLSVDGSMEHDQSTSERDTTLSSSFSVLGVLKAPPPQRKRGCLTSKRDKPCYELSKKNEWA